MEKVFNFVNYKELKYKLNSETGYYQKQPEIVPFLKLPFELKVEQTQKDYIIQQGAKRIITGRFKNKKREFFTGLIPVKTNFYLGNDYEFINGQKKNSLIVFEFSESAEHLTIYYFNRFYKDYPEERLKFVLSFIQHINHS